MCPMAQRKYAQDEEKIEDIKRPKSSREENALGGVHGGSDTQTQYVSSVFLKTYH